MVAHSSSFLKDSDKRIQEVLFKDSSQKRCCSLLGVSLSGSLFLVLSSDGLEVLVVLLEILVLLESDEELSLLGLTVLLALHGDGLGLDLLELSVLVSIQ